MSTFVLIGSNASYPSAYPEVLLGSDYSQLILEGGNISAVGDTYELTYPLLSAEKLATLKNAKLDDGSSRILLAYVNVAVTDQYRYYWNNSWISNPSESIGAFGISESDIGEVSELAPEWLQNNTGNEGGFGTRVDFADPEWQEIVYTQAKAYLDFGYSGLFLDNVASYFNAANNSSATVSETAADMMQLVVDLVEGLETELNRDIQVIINGDAYLLSNYVWGTVDSSKLPYDKVDWSLLTKFLDAIDGMLIENIGGDENAWKTAANWFNGPFLEGIYGRGLTTDPIELIAVENLGGYDHMMQVLTNLDANDISLSVSRDDNYTSILQQPIFGSSEADTLEGSSLDDVVFGMGGADVIYGYAGDDILYGGRAGSTIIGGVGDDVIYGGPGDDLIYGGLGNDTIYGGGGNDTIYGGSGSDEIYGGAGDDLIFSAGHDDLF